MIKVEHWYDSRLNIADLLDWMGRSECLDPEIAVDLLRHPAAFSPEWEEYCAAIRVAPPAEHEDDSTLEPMLQASLAVARGAKGTP